MEFLLTKGAHINGRDKFGGTAFHLAAQKERVEVMQMLLKHNASVNIRNRNNQTPVDIVCKGDNQKAKDILNNHLYKLQQSKLLK